MKTRVLIWWAKDGGSAEQMLDKWLIENDDKEIVQITQSEAGETTASRRITYTIFYK